MKKTLISAIVIAMCSSCSVKDDLETHFQEDNSLKIKSISVKTMDAEGYETLDTEGDAIGVFVDAVDGYKAYSNFRYTYKGGQWVEDDENNKIQMGYGRAFAKAYCPYGSTGITSSTDLTKIQLTSQKYTPEADLCYNVRTDLAALPSAVLFEMSHAYACLTLNIIKDPSYIGDGAIDLIETMPNQFPTSGEFDMKQCTYSNVKATGNEFNPGITALSTTTSTKISYLIVPSQSTLVGLDDVFYPQLVPIMFKVDGKYMAVYIPLTAFAPANRIEANTNYVVNIVVKPLVLRLKSVYKRPWNEHNLGTYDTDFVPIG